MADIDELTQQYLVGAGDDPDQPLPNQYDESFITPLLDATEYFSALGQALDMVGTGATPQENAGHYILIHGWWLGLAGGKYETGNPGPSSSIIVTDSPFFYLDGPPRQTLSPTPVAVGGTKPLLDILRQKARAGVDVRVMGWVLTGFSSNILAMLGGAKFFGQANAMTLKSLQALRGEPAIGMKAIVNDIAHPGGSAHTKMVVIGNPSQAVGFTGGIDLVNNRFSEHFHQRKLDEWHDTAVKVEGRAVLGLYNWFRALYEETRVRDVAKYRLNNLDFPGHGVGTGADATPPLGPFPPRITEAVGPHRVQILRTVPQFNFAFANTGPDGDPLSFAEDGLFEFRSGLKKAISGARQYLYMEDQGMWSVEVMSWVHDAIVANPELKVILVNGGVDPDDPVFTPGYIGRAMNIGLLRGGIPTNPDLTSSQKDQVLFCSRQRDVLVAETEIVSVVPDGDNFRVRLAATADRTFAEDSFVDLSGSVRQGGRHGNAFRIVGSHAAIAPGQVFEFTVAADTDDPVAVVNPAVGVCDLVILGNVTVHSKVVLADDAVGIVGSANTVMRRSLYTDLENSVSFVDPTEFLARTLRSKMWADHFHMQNPADLVDVQQSLRVWKRFWGVPPEASPSPFPRRLPFHFIKRELPFSAPFLDNNDIKVYNEYLDTDSRDNWGGFCPTIPKGVSIGDLLS